ncbi:MAG: hypothetical protein IJX63_11850 [Lachnospiraceae bacterium]|nr:hypothetical protein [Lachnospiraceae bacterium]
MSGSSKTKCFCILLFLMLGFCGCGLMPAPDSGMPGLSEELSTDIPHELVSIRELEKLAENHSWREELASRVSFEMSWHDTYGYDSLSDIEKIWYEDINLLLSTRYEGSIQLSKEGLEGGLSEVDLDRIYQCVLMDHPEYFYVTGYEYTKYTSLGKLLGIEVCGSYNADIQECILRKEQIETETDKLLAQAPVEASDYEKIKYVYETIIYQTEYDLEAPDNQNIHSVFIGKASVCQGYAKATQYLLGKLGVKCTLVQGKVSEGEGHSWNMVKSGEEYYYVDTTWGDASYTSDGELLEEDALEINYDYLCVTTEQLFKTHTPEQETTLPVCDTLEDNYYIREGCYFYGYDTEQLKREFSEIALEEQKSITIKCDSLTVYDEMYAELIENQRVFEYLPENHERVAFIQDEEHLSMTFWVTK